MTRYVIIGTGIAGMSAAASLRARHPSAEICLVSDDPDIFYSRPGLAYYLTGEIPEKRLYIYDHKDWTALNARVLKGRVVGIDPSGHSLLFQAGNRLTYDRLLLATGSASVPLGIPGASLKGVVKLDDLADARQILNLARHAKNALVIGGGVTSMELVEGLRARRVHVHYFLRGDRFWSNVLELAESRSIENHLVSEGVSLHFQTEAVEILGRGGRVAGVRTRNGLQLPCELVASAIGVRPRLELAQAAGLSTDRGILVNEFFQTSDPDIFAAGDVAQVYDPASGRFATDNLWNPGREQGQAAGWNMSGDRTPFQRPVAMNVLRLAGIMLTIIGSVGSGRDEDLVSVSRGSSETWLQLPNTIAMASGNEFNQLRLLVGQQTLRGALVLGEQKLSLPLQELVARQIDISAIRPALLQPGAQLGQIVMDFWTVLRR
jgi:NAD(P)H-nitrite reductase large subunit